MEGMKPVPPWTAILAALAVAIAAVLAGQQSPATPTTTTTTTTTTTLPAQPGESCVPVTTSPPSGPDLGAFRTPVAELTVNQRCHEWVERLFADGDAHGFRPKVEFGLLTDEPNNYGVPVYDRADATLQLRVRRKASFPGGAMLIGPNETVPWNPAWKPAFGKDGFLIVVDYETGQEWGFWNVSSPWYSHADNHSWGCVATENLPPPFGVGFDANRDLCAASAYTVRDPSGAVADVRTYTGNYPIASGGGWHLPLVTPEEVEAGKITHALHAMVFNTLSAPPCTAAQRQDPNALGTVCGDAIAPAGKMETPNDPGHRPLNRSVPEGMRFSVPKTDAEIEAWLDSRNYEGQLRRTAKVFAVALRDYGFFIGDTTAGGFSFSVSSGENPDTAAKWRRLGIQGDGKDLLDGYIDRLVAYEPPTNFCADGTRSRWHCFAGETSYRR